MNRAVMMWVVFLMASHFAKAQERWVLTSKYLTQPDTVLVYTPTGYQPAREYPLVYLLHGYSENYRQWSQTTDLQALADQYNFIIVTPDGFVSWFVNSPFDPRSRMEDFFFQTLVPKVHEKFKIDRRNIFVSGLSMGGYGALRYFILHNDYFNTAASTSGGLMLDPQNLKEVSLLFFKNTRITDDLTRLLGDPSVHHWHAYDITHLLEDHPPARGFFLDCGTEDVLLPATMAVKLTADQLGIPITFMTAPGNHHTAYWHQAIGYHFVYFRQCLVK